MPRSQNPTTSFGRTESLWQADDRRSVILTTILDALTHGPAPISNVTKFRLPTESSKPCSYSIKKWKFLVWYQNQAFNGQVHELVQHEKPWNWMTLSGWTEHFCNGSSKTPPEVTSAQTWKHSKCEASQTRCNCRGQSQQQHTWVHSTKTKPVFQKHQINPPENSCREVRNSVSLIVHRIYLIVCTIVGSQFALIAP